MTRNVTAVFTGLIGITESHHQRYWLEGDFFYQCLDHMRCQIVWTDEDNAPA
jgi:hypothetical protein